MVNLAIRIRIAVDTSAILPSACPSRCANGNSRVSSDIPVWLESRAFRKRIYGMAVNRSIRCRHLTSIIHVVALAHHAKYSSVPLRSRLMAPRSGRRSRDVLLGDRHDDAPSFILGSSSSPCSSLCPTHLPLTSPLRGSMPHLADANSTLHRAWVCATLAELVYASLIGRPFDPTVWDTL